MARSTISRRRFLLLTGGALGAGALACGGLAAAGSPQPETEPVEATYGGSSTMEDRILVAYATKTGSTSGVAEAVGRQLATDGTAVDVRQMKDVQDLGGYRAAVLGSAINGGKWLPEATRFVEANRAGLSRMPTAIFLVCLLAANPTEQNRQFVSTFLEPVRALVHPVAEGRFAGRLLYAKHPFFERLGMRIFARTQRLAEGDYRDWGAIRAWADATRPLLH